MHIHRVMNMATGDRGWTGCGWSAAAGWSSTTSASRWHRARVTGLLGPERLRQEHADARDRRRPAGRGRRDPGARPARPGRRRCATGSATAPRRRRSTPTCRSGRTCATSRPSSAHRRPTWTGSSTRSTCAATSTLVGRPALRRSGGPRLARRRAARHPRAARARRADGRPGPGAAPRPVDRCSARWPSGGPPCSSAATSWTRPRTATGCCCCATAGCSPTTPARACSPRPAPTDVEAAFLSLVDDAAGPA